MITPIEITWNNEYKHDGFLFFVQRIVEMLDYMTIDIYRAPLLNTSRLIDEYLKICQGAAKPYHLEEVYNEFIHTFKNDIVLQYKLGENRIQQIVNRLHKTPNKREETIDFLSHSVSSHYLQWTKEYIEYIVPQSKEKKKIERAIRCFIPELLRLGYSRDEIYHSAKQLLSDEVDPNVALSTFLQQYDQKSKKYSVYFGLSNRMKPFREILAARLGINYDADKNFEKLEIWEHYFPSKVVNISALDASTAASKAFKRIELFTTFYQCLGNYSENLIQNKVLVISEDGTERKLTVNRRKYKSIERDDPPVIGKLSEAIISSLLSSAKYSMPQIEKITKLHNRAISNNGLENGFINLWSIMEIICVSNSESSKIEQVKSVAIPVLKRDYLPSIFFDISENLKKVLTSGAYEKLIDDISDGTNDYEKIACLILLPCYSQKLDDFVDCLMNYPVLRTRMLNLHDDCPARSDLNKLVSRYTQRISWHLYRIYRARNAIVHSGKHPNDLKDLGEHLHTYVDSLVMEVIVKLSMGTLDRISNVLVDAELQQEINDSYFSENAPIDIEGINLIFSQPSSWSNF